MMRASVMIRKLLEKQLVKFLVIGGLAALTHLVIFALLDRPLARSTDWEYSEYLTNFIAFVVAFQVSYWGHSGWSFAGHGRRKRDTSWKFLSTSVFGLCLNQFLFFLLLNFTTLPNIVSLFIVLLVVAVVTFILSKLWAFNAVK